MMTKVDAMQDYRIEVDNMGMPVLRGSGTKPPKPERTTVRLGVELFHLYAEDGHLLGPTESLDNLLSEGPIAEGQYVHLANQFDDPDVLHSAARRLGVIRKRSANGQVVVCLPEPKDESNTADNPEENEETMTEINFADKQQLDLSVNNLTTVAEAQRLLGKAVIGTGLEIVKGEGRARYVRTNKLNALLSHSRGGRAKGAGAKIADAAYDATTRRAKSNRVGQANDERPSRGRRYRRASELSSDE